MIMSMCVGREGGRGCENEDVRMRMGVGRWCENEDGCWDRVGVGRGCEK